MVPADFVATNPVHGEQIVDGFAEGAEGLVMIEVADVLADEGLAIDDQRDGIFEVGAQSQDGACCGQRCDRAGSVTAGAAKDCRAESSGAGYGIVDAAGDGALTD